MSVIEVQVPDLGDVGEVGVIEVLVKPGDAVRLEQSLITVESDKASMEIPSPAAGIVRELRVVVGDKVRRGSQILSLEVTASVAGFDLGNEVEDLVSSDDLDTTQPLIMAGGGLRLATGGASSVDLGYRYTRILVDNPKINTSLVYLGINFGR